MPRVVVLLADGFEEVEALGIVDVLRRADIETVIAALREGPVASARKVRVLPDTTIDTITAEDFDMVVLPGGLVGSDNLRADERVRRLLREFCDRGKLTGAICAAPSVLAAAGLLEGRRATAYPSFKDRLGGAAYEDRPVVEDGTVLTSQGPGTALLFGLAIVERLAGAEKARAVGEAMLLPPR